MTSTGNRKAGDVAFEYGVRFHVAPPAHKMPPRCIMIAWDRTTQDGHTAIITSLDDVWPAGIPDVTAIIVGRHSELDEAIAFAGANLGAGNH